MTAVPRSMKARRPGTCPCGRHTHTGDRITRHNSTWYCVYCAIRIATRQTTLEEETTMDDTTLTITGNAVNDPELRYTAQGQPVARFRIASTPRVYDKTASEWKDGEGLFLSVQVWRQQAENVCESIHRGTRVVITGRLRQRSYETKDGEKRTVYEIDADDVAVSLKFATAKVTKATRSAPAPEVTGKDSDPWATAGPAGLSEPPF